MLLKCCTQYTSKFGKLNSDHRTGRGQFSFQSQRTAMGKTRDRFKKIRDTKGTFHAKMGTIKDRNGIDLTGAENINKRWQE